MQRVKEFDDNFVIPSKLQPNIGVFIPEYQILAFLKKVNEGEVTCLSRSFTPVDILDYQIMKSHVDHIFANTAVLHVYHPFLFSMTW